MSRAAARRPELRIRLDAAAFGLHSAPVEACTRYHLID